MFSFNREKYLIGVLTSSILIKQNIKRSIGDACAQYTRPWDIASAPIIMLKKLFVSVMAALLGNVCERFIHAEED